MPFSFSFHALATMILYSLDAPYTCMSLLVLFSPLQPAGASVNCQFNHPVYKVVGASSRNIVWPTCLTATLSTVAQWHALAH